MQLKSFVKKMSQDTGVSSQLVLQNYMLERLLERVSISKYNEHFILKGGYFIASLFGLATRSTMDIDATIKAFPVTEESIKEMFLDIISVQTNDGIQFELVSITEIREKDEYQGFRLQFSAKYGTMRIPVKVDVTTGDNITPHEMKYDYKLMFEDRSLSIFAYNYETLLAEKLETIISRSTENTRARDFYDIFIFLKLKRSEIDNDILKKALDSTAQKRGTERMISHWQEVLTSISNSQIMQNQWKKYSKTYPYAADIDFEECISAIRELMNEIK